MTKSLKTAKPTRRAAWGSNAVEFALVLPILLMLVSGVMDYGWYFVQNLALQSAARDAARSGAVASTSEDPLARATTRAESVLMDHGLMSASTVRVRILTDGLGDDVLSVRIVTEFEPLVHLVPVPDVMRASVTMRVENQPIPNT